MLKLSEINAEKHSFTPFRTNRKNFESKSWLQLLLTIFMEMFANGSCVNLWGKANAV